MFQLISHFLYLFHFAMQAIQKSGGIARKPLHSIWSCVRGSLKHTTCYYYFLDLVLRPLLPHHHCRRRRLVKASIYFIIVIINNVSFRAFAVHVVYNFNHLFYLLVSNNNEWVWSLCTWRSLIRVPCRFVHWLKDTCCFFVANGDACVFINLLPFQHYQLNNLQVHFKLVFNINTNGFELIE